MKNITALITPFNEDLSLDYKTLTSLISFQEKSKIEGLLLLGTTAESFSLTLKEKLKICSIAFNKFSRTKIICIEGNNDNKILDQIDIFKSFKPDYFLITPPFFNKGNNQGIIEYFYKIADYSQIPIIIYNIPSRCGFDIDFSCLEKLSKHDNILGIKNASFNVSYNLKLSQLNNKNFKILSGNDETLFQNLTLNGNGCISVISNLIPNYLTDILDIYEVNPKKSSEMFKCLIPIFENLNKRINPFPIKKIMGNLNIIKDYLRSPFSNSDNFRLNINKERNILNEYFTYR